MQQVIQDFRQLLQRGRLYAAEGGDTQHDVVTFALVEFAQHVRRLVTFEVDQNGGDDLRVLFADKVEHRLRIHKVERFDAVGALVGIQQILQQRGGTLFAQRLDQHAAQIIVGVEAERRIFAGVFFKLLQHHGHLVVSKARHVDH